MCAIVEKVVSANSDERNKGRVIPAFMLLKRLPISTYNLHPWPVRSFHAQSETKTLMYNPIETGKYVEAHGNKPNRHLLERPTRKVSLGRFHVSPDPEPLLHSMIEHEWLLPEKGAIELWKLSIPRKAEVLEGYNVFTTTVLNNKRVWLPSHIRLDNCVAYVTKLPKTSHYLSQFEGIDFVIKDFSFDEPMRLHASEEIADLFKRKFLDYCFWKTETETS